MKDGGQRGLGPPAEVPTSMAFSDADPDPATQEIKTPPWNPRKEKEKGEGRGDGVFLA